MMKREVKAKKGGWSQENMQRAIDDVIKDKLPIKTAADKYEVDRSSLRRRLCAIRKGDLLETKAYGKSSMKVFSKHEELQLKEYLVHASKMGYDLSTNKLRTLAYEFALKLEKKLPHSRRGRPNPWMLNKEAGKDWQRAFLKRHPDLSIRKPEPTSIGRIYYVANPNPVIPIHDITNPDETSQRIADTTLLITPQQVARNSTTITPSDQQPNGSSVTPETIRPLPKAAARKKAKGGKKK